MCALLNAFREGVNYEKKLNDSFVREREREREREHTSIFVFPSLAGITQHGFIIISRSVDYVIKFLHVYTRRKTFECHSLACRPSNSTNLFKHTESSESPGF